MLDMRELGDSLAKGKQYNTNVSIRAVEQEDDKLIVKAIANKFLDSNGAPVEDNHGTILTQATLDTSSYMEYNSVVLAHHNSERPVGKVTHLNSKEDGLEVILEVYKDNDAQIFNQVKRGTLNGLSVGMYIKKSEYSEILDSVIIREAELVEISLVTNPSNPLSFIESVDMCSLGVCSAIRSGKTLKEDRSVDKEAMKIMLKQLLDEENEAKKLAEELEAEVARLADAARLAEEAKLADAETARLAEEAEVERLAEEARVAKEAEANKETEEEKVARLAKEAEDAKLVEEEKVAEGIRLAEEARVAEEARIAALKPGDEGYDIIHPNVSFEERLEEASLAFANKEEGANLTSEQVNLLTFIAMNYGTIEEAFKQHLE